MADLFWAVLSVLVAISINPSDVSMNIKFETENKLLWHNFKARFARFLFQDPANPKGRSHSNFNGSMRIGDSDLYTAIHKDRTLGQRFEIVMRNYQGRLVFGIFCLMIFVAYRVF